MIPKENYDSNLNKYVDPSRRNTELEKELKAKVEKRGSKEAQNILKKPQYVDSETVAASYSFLVRQLAEEKVGILTESEAGKVIKFIAEREKETGPRSRHINEVEKQIREGIKATLSPNQISKIAAKLNEFFGKTEKPERPKGPIPATPKGKKLKPEVDELIHKKVDITGPTYAPGFKRDQDPRSKK